MSECIIHSGSQPPQNALDTPIECSRCGSKVPSSTALSLEGADYLRYFCGQDCLAQWCERNRKR